MIGRFLATIFLLVLFGSSVSAETLDVFFGNKLRAEDVWADNIEWRYPLGEVVKYRIKKTKTGENGVVVEWLLPDNRTAIKVRYVYGQLDFNLPFELVSSTTWVKEDHSAELFLAQVLYFNSREKRSEPLMMRRCSGSVCENILLTPSLDLMSRQFGSGVARDIANQKTLQVYSLTHDYAGNVIRELSINFREDPYIQYEFFYNKEEKIYKIVTKVSK